LARKDKKQAVWGIRTLIPEIRDRGSRFDPKPFINPVTLNIFVQMWEGTQRRIILVR
jgi:hypothetical protein